MFTRKKIILGKQERTYAIIDNYHYIFECVCNELNNKRKDHEKKKKGKRKSNVHHEQ